MRIESAAHVPDVTQLNTQKIKPLTTEILSLPVTEGDVNKRYDTVELTSQQEGQSSEETGTYTRQFKRTSSGQISALLDDPLDDPPAIVITKSPEQLESWRKSQLYWAAADSWNAKVDELKATVKARNYGYNETIKLFKEGYADWKADLKKANPEAYLLWIERAGESE